MKEQNHCNKKKVKETEREKNRPENFCGSNQHLNSNYIRGVAEYLKNDELAVSITNSKVAFF